MKPTSGKAKMNGSRTTTHPGEAVTLQTALARAVDFAYPGRVRPNMTSDDLILEVIC